MILPAIIGAVPYVYQAAVGLNQLQQGQRGLRGLRRPQYSIPTAQQGALALARSAYADPRMPGEATAYSRIGQQMANFANTARDNQNVAAGLVQAQAMTNEANRDMAAQSAQFQLANQQNLQAQLGQYGQYQDMQWQLNKFAPYAQRYNEYREQVGAGQQNLMGAITGAANIAMTAIGDLNLSMRARSQDRRMSRMYNQQMAAQAATQAAAQGAVQQANNTMAANQTNAVQQAAVAATVSRSATPAPQPIATTVQTPTPAPPAQNVRQMPNPTGPSRSSVSGSPVTISDFTATYTPASLGGQQRMTVNAGGQDIQVDLSTGRLVYEVQGQRSVGTIEDLFQQNRPAFEALINQLNSQMGGGASSTAQTTVAQQAVQAPAQTQASVSQPTPQAMNTATFVATYVPSRMGGQRSAVIPSSIGQVEVRFDGSGILAYPDRSGSRTVRGTIEDLQRDNPQVYQEVIAHLNGLLR